METVFVTGGSGFVGRNLIRELVRRNINVRALSRSETASKMLEGLGAEVVFGDLDAVDVMTEAMRGCDVVFHCAAYVEESGDPYHFHQINVTGTENVLSAAKTAGVPTFVHLGTEAVLIGGPRLINADETWPLPKKNIGLYPSTKALAEKAVLAANGRAMKTISVRPRFIWGRDDTSVMPKFIEAIKGGKFVWINGGHYPVSTCHINNVVEGLLLAAEKGEGGEIYFLTDGEPVEFRTFITDLLATQGVDVPGRSIPRPLARAAANVADFIWNRFKLKSDPPITRARLKLVGEEATVNDAKARSELGYEGKISVEEGLAEMRQAAGVSVA